MVALVLPVCSVLLSEGVLELTPVIILSHSRSRSLARGEHARDVGSAFLGIGRLTFSLGATLAVGLIAIEGFDCMCVAAICS